MKKGIALLLLIFAVVFVHAQHIISVNGKQVLKANEEDDNAGKKVGIKSKAGYPAAAVFEVKDLKGSKKMVRSYLIYDAQDNVILKLGASKKRYAQQVLLKDLLSKLEPGKKFFLYSSAIPSDPQLAAAVRVKRVLLCIVSAE